MLHALHDLAPNIITPHAQHERDIVIGVGVHIYIYILYVYMFVDSQQCNDTPLGVLAVSHSLLKRHTLFARQRY